MRYTSHTHEERCVNIKLNLRQNERKREKTSCIQQGHLLLRIGYTLQRVKAGGEGLTFMCSCEQNREGLLQL